MPDKSDLGDRMKKYEMQTDNSLIPLIPVVARLDGKAFHTFTRGLGRPYDSGLSNLMIETTKYLVSEMGARIGCTQSDEITLVWHIEDPRTEFPFGGRIFKLISILAAKTSTYFNFRLVDFIPNKVHALPVFDCRIFNVPSRVEAVNCLIWREQDAVRNSISMAAQAHYSHKQLFNKSCAEMQELLFQKGINWNNYPPFFKRGTYVQKRIVERPFTTDEIMKLPPKHEAHQNPDLVIKRTDYKVVYLPPLTQISNREDVIFNGCDPEKAK